MLRSLWRRLVRPRIEWQRSIVELHDLEALARSGLAGMLLAQEKARLDFVQARETHERQRDRASRDRMNDRLHDLQATSAIVQSLLNEQHLEQLLAVGSERTSPELLAIKCR